MGHARCSITCLISSTTSQRPKVLYCVVFTNQQHLRQEEKASPRSSSSLFVLPRFLNRLTWLQVISMEQRGAVAAETTSVLLTKPFLIVPCLRHRASHRCGRPGSIPNNWADVCGFLKPQDSQRFWKVSKHGAFSIPRRTLALRPTDQSCIMRHGFIWISSTGAILGNHKVNMIDEFSTKNVLRRLSKERRRGGSVIL